MGQLGPVCMLHEYIWVPGYSSVVYCTAFCTVLYTEVRRTVSLTLNIRNVLYLIALVLSNR